MVKSWSMQAEQYGKPKHATNQVVLVKKENYNFLDQNTRKTQTH